MSSTPTLTTEQNVRYQKILNAPHLKNHRLIRLENLATTQFQGKLAIRLAGLACENLLFQARNVEYTSENDYYWYGVMGKLKRHSGQTREPPKNGIDSL